MELVSFHAHFFNTAQASRSVCQAKKFKFANEKDIEKINKEDASILYELLKTRRHNISHESLPNFETHKKFVENNVNTIIKNIFFIIIKISPFGLKVLN